MNPDQAHIDRVADLVLDDDVKLALILTLTDDSDAYPDDDQES